MDDQSLSMRDLARRLLAASQTAPDPHVLITNTIISATDTNCTRLANRLVIAPDPTLASCDGRADH
jgi:hypothetical protein